MTLMLSLIMITLFVIFIKRIDRVILWFNTVNDLEKNRTFKEKKHELLAFKDPDIIEAYEWQIKYSSRTLFDEREFMENLFNTRVNYFIVVLSIVFAAFTQMPTKPGMIVILSMGIVLLILLALNLYRAYLKFDINLKMVHKIDSKNAVSMVQKEINKRRRKGGYIGLVKGLFPTNKITGIYIPLFGISSMMILLILVCANVIAPK